jgi:hypothetical protein
MTTPIVPIQDTNNIRYADFVRIVTPVQTFMFANTSSSITVSAISSMPFDGLGQLVSIGKVQRDIKSTANQTTISINGIDAAMLGLVLSQEFKGAQITMWKGFFDTSGNLITTGGTGGLYQYFYGFVNTFAINEQWMEEARMYVGTITVSAANIQMILQNRIVGRFTNDSSWEYYTPGDTSMNRVSAISTIYYAFGAATGVI